VADSLLQKHRCLRNPHRRSDLANVIDAHVHLFLKGCLPQHWYDTVARRWADSAWPARDPASLKVEAGLIDEDAALLPAELDRAGIDAAVVQTLDWSIEFGDAPIAIGDVHARYGELQRRNPGRIFFGAGIDPRRKDAVELLNDAVGRHDLKALKIYPPAGYLASDPVCHPLYRKCIELGLPLVVHTAFVGYPHVGRYAYPLWLNDVQLAFPDLTIVLAHSGYPFWSEEAIEVASHHPRSFLEVSNWNLLLERDRERVLRLIVRMRDAVGAHRVLFASDHLGGPRFSGGRSKLPEWVEFFRELPKSGPGVGATFSEEEVALILGENARRVFRLPMASSDSNVSRQATVTG
jgi:predicted TIM-barrel fold metal-dependent hydrolase